MTRFSLEAPDGRRVTSDTVAGASLTSNSRICYVWDSYNKAERQRAGCEVILGTRLVAVNSLRLVYWASLTFAIDPFYS